MAEKKLKCDELTGKERLFCEGYVIHYNGAKAVRDAEYVAAQPSEKAYRLLRKPKVERYIRHLERERSRQMDMKADDIYAMLKMIASEPHEKTTDRIKCLELMGRTHKMFIDKLDINANHKHSNESEEDIKKRLDKLKKKREYDDI